MATLYIVATPIGNLEDISLRALRILGEVDFILCEDTRVTAKLLSHYKINTPAISHHQHSDIKKTDYILDLLSKGKNLALVSDAGTPGISDPGGKLVQAVINRFGINNLETHSNASVRIESVPGPSAVAAALSISGIPTDKFVFMGFPPHKKGRQKFLKKIIASEYPVVIYESKHRIIKLLKEFDDINKKIAKIKVELKKSDKISNFPRSRQAKRGRQFLISKQFSIFPGLDKRSGAGNFKISKDEFDKIQPVSSVVVCRELSKMHETVYRGGIKSIINKIKENKDEQKGEFVVVIGK